MEITQERIMQEKVRVAYYYQRLLYYTLDDCLMKFCRRNVDQYMRSYIENCISMSFFRVVRFKELFLNCVSERINVEIPEWKGITWDINSRSQNIEQSLVRFFDWHMNLFQYT